MWKGERERESESEVYNDVLKSFPNKLTMLPVGQNMTDDDEEEEEGD